jgi:hypothetical protein
MSDNFFSEFTPSSPESTNQSSPLPSMATWKLVRRTNDGSMFLHDPSTGNMVAYPGGQDVPVTPAERPSVAEDVARGSASGLATGAVGLAGAIPSASQGLRQLADKYLFDPVLGKIPEGTPKPPDVADYVGAPALDKALQSVAPAAGYDPKTTIGKLAKGGAEFVPGALLAPGGLAARAANAVRGGVIPGVTSEAAGEAAEGSGHETAARVVGALVGGKIGPAVTNLPGRFVSPLPIPPERAGLVKLLQGEDIPLTAGQQTGNKPLQWAESILSDMPFAGGKAQAIQRAQGQRFTQTALSRAGIDADSLRQAGLNDVPDPLLATPEVLRTGRAALGKRFEDLSARNTLQMDQQFGQDIGKSLGEYQRLVNATKQAPGVADTASDLLTKAVANGTIPGDEYQAMRSRFSKTADRLSVSDAQQADAYRGMRDALDNAMERSVNPGDKGEWGEIRNKYANLKVLESAANKPGEEGALGYVSPARLRTAVADARDAGYSLGKGDLAPLARAGVGAMTPLPNSGTAPRSYYQHLTQLAGMAAGGTFGGVPGAGEGLAAAVGGPALVGRTLMSRPAQAYFANQAAPNIGLISKMDPAARELTRGTNLLQALFNPPGRSASQGNQ